MLGPSLRIKKKWEYPLGLRWVSLWFVIVAFPARLGMSVTTQGGSGRQYVTGPGRNISKYMFVLLNVYRFREI